MSILCKQLYLKDGIELSININIEPKYDAHGAKAEGSVGSSILTY